MKPISKPAKEKLSKAFKRLSIAELGLIAKAEPKKIKSLAKAILSIRIGLRNLQNKYKKL